MEFCTIASGSSGNSTYIGTAYTKILIDAGVSGKRIQDALGQLGISGEDIDALFLTHEHIDHIQGAGVISRRFHVPIYATEETWAAIGDSLGKIAPDDKRYVYPGEVCAVNDICVRPFSIPHDAAEPVGYNVMAEDRKATLATDIGHVTDEICEALADSDILLLEANHDVEMLKKGGYPRLLKERILGENGHLSNHTAGELLSSVMSGRLKHVFLGHLSKENNTPDLAYGTVERILWEHHIQNGRDLRLDLAGRSAVGRRAFV